MKIRFEFNSVELKAISNIGETFREYTGVFGKMLNARKPNNNVKVNENIVSWEKEQVGDIVAVDIKINSNWFCKLCGVYSKGLDTALNMVATVAPTLTLFAYRMKSVNSEYGEVLMEAIDTKPTVVEAMEEEVTE